MLFEMRKIVTTPEERHLLVGVLMGAMEWGGGPATTTLTPPDEGSTETDIHINPRNPR